MTRDKLSIYMIAMLTSLAACQRDDAAIAPQTSSLPEGVVARVGEHAITADTIARIAGAQRIDPNMARELAVRDALFACEAEARGIDSTRALHLSVQEALARRALRALYDEASRAPITEDELTQASERRWLEIARPEGFRTAHALLRLDPDADEDKRSKALAIAEAIRQATLPLSSRAEDLPSPKPFDPSATAVQLEEPDPLAGEFLHIAKGIAHEGFELVLEPLLPVAADGRVLVRKAQPYDETFARAASALSRRGEISPATVSPFGVHVIILLERVPPSQLSETERRGVLTNDIVSERAKKAQMDLLARLRNEPKASEVEPGVDALLAQVVVEQVVVDR